MPILLDQFSILELFVITLVILLVVSETGYRLGKYRRSVTKPEFEGPVRVGVAAILGLMAFMIAFSFGMAGSRFELRRALVLDEANAIRTTYLRADYLPEPHQSAIHKLLQDYVSNRLRVTQKLNSQELEQTLQESLHTLDLLWIQAVEVAKKHPDSFMVGLFVESLNEVINIHGKRLKAGLQSRMPETIWIALYILATIAMAAMGYHSGLTGERSLFVNLALIVAFSAVLALIIDIDRPWEQFFQINQQPMIDLLKQFQAK